MINWNGQYQRFFLPLLTPLKLEIRLLYLYQIIRHRGPVPNLKRDMRQNLKKSHVFLIRKKTITAVRIPSLPLPPPPSPSQVTLWRYYTEDHLDTPAILIKVTTSQNDPEATSQTVFEVILFHQSIRKTKESERKERRSHVWIPSHLSLLMSWFLSFNKDTLLAYCTQLEIYSNWTYFQQQMMSLWNV